jgi:pilus assembly protein Flp/PilA
LRTARPQSIRARFSFGSRIGIDRPGDRGSLAFPRNFKTFVLAWLDTTRARERRLQAQVTDMLLSKIDRFASDESGATAVEYAMIAGIISISIVASLKLISTTLSGNLNSVASGFESAND